MNTDDTQEPAHDLLSEADNLIRANPIPAVLTAFSIGLMLGMATRVMGAPERKSDQLRDALDDFRSLLSTSAKRGKRVYADSAEAVRDAVEHAVEKARDVEVDPVAKWWKRLWS